MPNLCTHYGVLVFTGDPGGEHPDPELNGDGPSMRLIASGPEEFCWDALRQWTACHPLRMWEKAEVLTRDPSVVKDPAAAAARLLADAIPPGLPPSEYPNSDPLPGILATARAMAGEPVQTPETHMITVECTYEDGDTVTTRFNGSFAAAQEYYIGHTFNVGGGPEDNVQRCVSIRQLEG